MFSCCFFFFFFFSFSISSGRRSLKIKKITHTKIQHEKSGHRSIMYVISVPRNQVYIDTNPGLLESPLTGINFHGPTLFEPLKFYYIWKENIRKQTL